MRRWLWPAWLLAALLASACAEPPTKEMDQAQAAIDAAKAANADRYAAEDYNAAIDALAKSRAAVNDKDYRLALNNALDSRDRAQTATKTSNDAKSAIKAEVERTLADVATPLADAHARIAAAQRAHAPQRAIRAASAALSSVDADVQKAGEAQKAEDYGKAQALLKNVRERIGAATEHLGRTPPKPEPPPPTRKRR